jgi:hypothetical protein
MPNRRTPNEVKKAARGMMVSASHTCVAGRRPVR